MQERGFTRNSDVSSEEPHGAEVDARTHFRRALDHLQRAADLAAAKGVAIWQFAVEVDDLLEMGLTRLDIRWLVSQGLIQHGYEVESNQSGQRDFVPESMGSIRDTSCFVLAQQPADTMADLRSNAKSRNC